MKTTRFLSWFAIILSTTSWVVNNVESGNLNINNTVTYDARSLIINGQRRILFSGSIHYPRSTPRMWPSLISKAKAGGVDVIETYVFWNLHEPQNGQYDFSGRKDINRFIKEIQSQGLYACIRIGPYIESEWNYGGIPFWLRDVPGMVFRSDNQPFKFHMQRFTTYIVNMLKSQGFYASQGGPIILSQIENEYQTVEPAFHQKGPSYVRWAAKMAVDLQTGVPWVMCKQNDAPDPVINSCNGMRCGETFVGPNSPNKPAIWTENWTSFLQKYGDEPRIRSAQDIAYHVALFLAKKGSFVNYYMYHGGTNFGRTSSSYIITGYYDQAPLDEYGLIRQPKWGHLKELHAAIKLCSETLLSGSQTTITLGPQQMAYAYEVNSGKCAALLVNNDTRKEAVVFFHNTSFMLPPKSISISPDCKSVVFNTAKVSTEYNTRRMQPSQRFYLSEKWEEFTDAIYRYDETTLKANTILEHMDTTKDVSDYLWYTFRVNQSSSSASQFVLDVNSLGHVLYAFVNGVFIGSAHGDSGSSSGFSLQNTIYLKNGMNDISLLSVMVGLPNSGAFLERRVAGLRRVRLQGNSETSDLSNYPWGYQVGLLGEKEEIFSESGSARVEWSELGSSHRPLTWYKTKFDGPAGSEPVALNLGSMGKGEAWVNGQSIGRYWISYRTSKGLPSQTWYHVPRSFLKASGNLLVVQEEENGNPLGISIDTISVSVSRI